MKILVTGASGFVGHHLVAELESSGHDLVLVGLRAEGSVLGCDITNRDEVEALVFDHQPDAIVHLAGMAMTNIEPSSVGHVLDVNVLGTMNLCRATLRLSKPLTFLFASSGLVYGSSNPVNGYSEEDTPNPSQLYAQSKLAAEEVVRLFDGIGGFKGYIARPFNHIGPFQGPNFVVPDFGSRIKKAPKGGEIPVGDLSAERDFSDVRDIVRAYRLIIEKKPSSRLFVLGSGKPTRISRVLSLLLDISGKELNIKKSEELVRDEPVSSIFGNCRRAEEELGWRATIPLETSLRDAYTHL